MKKVIALILGLVLFVSLCACAAPAAPAATEAPAVTEAPAAATEAPAVAETPAKKTSDWVIGYICKDLSQQWFIDTLKGMETEAKKRGAKEIIALDAGMNAEKYLNHLDNLISQKVDMIIVCPPDQNLSQVTVDRCKAANIPVIADADGLIDTNGIHLAPALELNAFVVGTGMGEWLGKYINENKLLDNMGEFGYMVMTMNEVSSCVPRHEGAVAAVKAACPTIPEENFIYANYDGTPEKGFDVAAATITANPKVKYWVVTAPNDEGAVGACRALEAAGKDKEAAVVGCGAYHAKDEFKKEYSPMKAASFFDPILCGTTEATLMMDYLVDGKTMCEDYVNTDKGETFGVYPFSGVMVDITTYKDIMGPAAE